MMLLLLLACVEGDEITGVPVSEEPAAPAGDTVLLGVALEANDPRVVEVDASGKEIWSFPVSGLFGDEWAAMSPKPLLMEVQPVAGGTILLSLYGEGIYEINRAGEVLWHHDDPEASHDVDRLANGNTLYARTWAPEGEPAVIEVDPAGKVVWTWDGMAAFGSNPLFSGYKDELDAWMHPTAVQRMADGTTSICLRNFNRVVRVDAAGAVVREVSFRSPEGADGPVTEGRLQGYRPHGAEWNPGVSMSVALRKPHRSVLMQDGKVLHEYRSADIEGITDVDVAADGGMLIVSHREVRRVDAQGAVLWSWAVPVAEGASSDTADRHIFNTASRIDASGAPVDFD